MLKTLFFGVLVFICNVGANAQEKSTTEKIFKKAVVIVGQTAEITAKTIQITAPIVYKITEKTTVIAFKTASAVIKKTFPIGRKLIVTYLKVKLPV